MGVTITCLCGTEISADSEPATQENLTLECSECGRGFMVTVTQYQSPDGSGV